MAYRIDSYRDGALVKSTPWVDLGGARARAMFLVRTRTAHGAAVVDHETGRIHNVFGKIAPQMDAPPEPTSDSVDLLAPGNAGDGLEAH
jgi:hypothetical protein